MHDVNLEDYKKLLSFPSVSSEPEFKQDLLDCMQWLKEQLEAIGMTTEVWPTAGHPVLFASKEVGKNKPTVLFYNHYDVQPVDPLELWTHPPFEPTVKDDIMYARGAQDNKGQLFYVLQALKEMKNPPVNLKWVIEGEEEMGSQGLKSILEKYRDKLKADSLVIVDVGIPNKDTPAVSIGMRGLIAMEVEAIGSSGDLHSGTHGGLAYNPIRALVELIAQAKDENGKITIPGFYDPIKALSEEEKKPISFEFNEAKYEKDFGITPTGGERNLSPLERNWLRPTLEVNGISGGYTGKGFKTVIPARASAKISCRLVQGQDPETTSLLVARYFESNAPPGIKIQVHRHEGGGPAILTSPHSKTVQAFAKAFSEVFQKPCQYILEGASIPIVADLQKASSAEVVLVGLGLATDQIHAPNEHFSLDRLKKGQIIISKALTYLA